jgi:site-specific DNA-methyltransferase (adenine-specific)
MDFMADKPDNAYDLSIVDPPYGIGDVFIPFTTGVKSGKIERKHKKMEWDNIIPSKDYFDELKRVSERRIIWGANYFNCFDGGGAIVWYKNKGAPSLSQCEIASISGQKKVDYFYYQSLGGFMARENTIHPTQKPQELYRWLLKNYAKPGDKILDTHGGSGSICIACHDMGFDLDWVELDKDYYDAAVKRFNNHKSQIRMF